MSRPPGHRRLLTLLGRIASGLTPAPQVPGQLEIPDPPKRTR